MSFIQDYDIFKLFSKFRWLINDVDVADQYIRTLDWIGVAVMTQSELTIKNVSWENLGQIPNVFRKLGIQFEKKGDDISSSSPLSRRLCLRRSWGWSESNTVLVGHTIANETTFWAWFLLIFS